MVKTISKRRIATYTCGWCGKSFEAKREAKVCSPTCRTMAARGRARAATLEGLGIEFKVDPKPDGSGDYIWFDIPTDAMLIIERAAEREGITAGEFMRSWVQSCVIRAKNKEERDA